MRNELKTPADWAPMDETWIEIEARRLRARYFAGLMRSALIWLRGRTVAARATATRTTGHAA